MLLTFYNPIKTFQSYWNIKPVSNNLLKYTLQKRIKTLPFLAIKCDNGKNNSPKLKVNCMRSFVTSNFDQRRTLLCLEEFDYQCYHNDRALLQIVLNNNIYLALMANLCKLG